MDKKRTIHFYEKCLDKRLAPEDFSFAGDGQGIDSRNQRFIRRKQSLSLQ